MKPALFVGSSTESLNIAYALQECLESVADVTVWTQGIFELSQPYLDSLLNTLDSSDFGIFIFSPDDVSIIRGSKKASVRDNVIFELGLFIGRLGKERNFIILPRGEESLDFPTDLLGLTPADFDAKRRDGNLNAALGPASNKISKSINKLGILPREAAASEATLAATPVAYSEGDFKAVLASWMRSRSVADNRKVIHFAKVDSELELEPGTARKHVKEVARKLGYAVEHEGEHTILFRLLPRNIPF